MVRVNSPGYTASMCGRFSLYTPAEVLAERFQAEPPPEGLRATYNAAPSQALPVIRNDDPQHITLAVWGYLPHWAARKPTVRPQINARAETLTEKPFFREALAQRRCLVLADSFYEWNREGKHRTPYRILLNTEEPFAFAGIWDRIPGPQGESLPHFAIITTASNTLISTIHDRMPVILRKEDEPHWLDPTASATAVLPLLQSYPATELKLYEVSPMVNSPKMDSPDLILPA